MKSPRGTGNTLIHIYDFFFFGHNLQGLHYMKEYIFMVISPE